MTALGARYRVSVDNPSAYNDQPAPEVTVDGRDWSAMELKEFPPTASVTATRYMTWHALQRQGVTRRSWEQFNATDCIRVDALDDDTEGEGEQDSLDPGRPATNGRDESISRSRRANRSTASPASSTGQTGT
jgi:hypothetical protein